MKSIQKSTPKLYIAIPLLEEYNHLPSLVNDILLQTFPHFEVYFCVNQPDDWWNNPTQKALCLDNQKSIDYLLDLKEKKFHVIDKSSPGKGWSTKKKGVGMARKTLFENILLVAEPHDLIVSLDADTYISPLYFESIYQRFGQIEAASGIAVPYYHPQPSAPILSRSLLYYEIYMRYYLLNLLRIGCPYAFTALGSAFAFRANMYKKVGGLIPKEAGEDFYFLQKIAKKGILLLWNELVVYPSSRTSARTPFGTGKAIQKGIRESMTTFPLFDLHGFKLIEESYALFPLLFEKDISLPIDPFLLSHTKTNLPWGEFRKNFKNRKNFFLACHEYFDGLRILQFLREQQGTNCENEKNLREYLNAYHQIVLEDFSFATCDLSFLTKLRNLIFSLEMTARKEHDNHVETGHAPV